jgi:hypothetical protein
VFFAEESDKKRNHRREEIYKETVQPAQNGDAKALNRLQQLSDTLRTGDKPVFPFHWEIEFPEVFDRDNPGFDCFVGNPPFLGGSIISTQHGDRYRDLIYAAFPESGNRMDLVAYFFRRGFSFIRHQGTCGLVATNTIAQGDTREGGLHYIIKSGGRIFHARRRVVWPGLAAVHVSIVHLQKTKDPIGKCSLDDIPTSNISSFLLAGAAEQTPHALKANDNRSFKGAMILGAGLTFDDTDESASSFQTMHQLIRKNPRNKERIFPLIGGYEINSSPTHTSTRYVINFEQMSESEARMWPDLIQILEAKVRPEREKKKREGYSKYWWQFGLPSPALFKTIRPLPRVLAASIVSKHLSFAFLPSGIVFSHKAVVIADPSAACFAVVQSRVHEVFVRFTSSTMRDDLNYSPSDSFETFPFPPSWQQNLGLELVGETYYKFRAVQMVHHNEGLTVTYNRFHDPDEQSPDILKLRELHAEMDRAVLTAYGWTDLAERATCEFRLDYEDDDDPDADDAPRARAKKKPWRYRWPQDFHDEVLARLLDLNQQRAEEERLAGVAAEAKGARPTAAKKTTKAKASARRSKGPTDSGQGGLGFDD